MSTSGAIQCIVPAHCITPLLTQVFKRSLTQTFNLEEEQLGGKMTSWILSVWRLISMTLAAMPEESAHHLVDYGFRAHDPSKPHVSDLGYPGVPQKDVGALQVHVNDSAAVQEVHAASYV